MVNSDYAADRTTNEYRSTYVERDATRPSGTGTGIAFIVGALVVAALVLFWLFSSGDGTVTQPAPPADVTITVPDSNTAAPAETAPAAPAETAPAPAADTETEGAAPAAPAGN